MAKKKLAFIIIIMVIVVSVVGLIFLLQGKGPRPSIESVDYPVIAHGGNLVIGGTHFNGSSISVTVGGVPQLVNESSFSQVTITLDDSTPLNAQPLVVTTDGMRSAAFTITVIHLVINELDCNTPATDTEEFIEIATGVSGITLENYTLVLFNGATDQSYRTIDFGSNVTDANGLIVVGNMAVPGVDIIIPNGSIQNGADGVAIYQGSANAYPDGSSPTNASLIDALVYGTSDPDASGLLSALLGSPPEAIQVDEDYNGIGDLESIQRTSSERLDGRAFSVGYPSPDDPNPKLGPIIGSVNYPVIAHGGTLVIAGNGLTGISTSVTVGGVSQLITGETYTQINITLNDSTPLSNQSLIVTTDGMSSTAFTVTVIHLVINELDCDTPATDTEEFIEIATGVSGITLENYCLVLFNGATDQSYRTIDFGSNVTDSNGLIVVGNVAVPGVDIIIPNGSIQNGADGAAIYQGPASSYPDATSATNTSLIDALVYGTGDPDASGLLSALLGSPPEAIQVDENYNANSALESIQRTSSERLDGRAFSIGTPSPDALNS